MIFKEYSKQTDKWVEVAKTHNITNVPNAFAQVLYNYKDKIQLQDVNEAIETGTFEGETAIIFSDLFHKVHTVEQYMTNNTYTSIDLEEKYKELKNQYKNIDFYVGDSVNFLKKILSNNTSTQFVILLDAHTPSYSPILQELQAIKESSTINNHIIIIDDCIDLNSSGWPTRENLIQTIKSINENYKIENTGLGREITIIYE
jgi:putative lipase involved disintegration of autophagic bodies